MNTKQKIHQAHLSRWSELFKEQLNSGINVNDWCKQHSISRHNFYYWKRQLKDAMIDDLLPEILPIPSSLSDAGAAPTPLPITNTPLHHVSEKLYNSNHTLLITCRDIQLSFAPSVPDSVILQLLKVVRHA